MSTEVKPIKCATEENALASKSMVCFVLLNVHTLDMGEPKDYILAQPIIRPKKKKLLCCPFPTDPKSCKIWVGIFFFSIQTSIFTVNLLQNLPFLAQDHSV